MRQGIIYKYTSPSNKSYIGQTIQGELRKQQHRKNAYNENYIGYNYPFYNAIRKYGFDSFTYEILITINEVDVETLFSRLNELEIYYIGKFDSYNNGYNSSIGGQGLTGNSHPSNKKVSQYDLDGNFITVFESAAIATRSIGLKDSSTIIKCCNFKAKSSGGFQWRYYNENHDNIDPITKRKEKKKYIGIENKKSKKVFQYTLDKVLVKE